MKRTIAVLAAGLVGLTLAGCGGGGAANAAMPAVTPAAGAATTPAGTAGGAMQDPAAMQDPTATKEAAGMQDEAAAHAALPTGMSSAAAKAAGMGMDGAPVVSVTGTDTTCQVNMMSVPAGKTWFKITNKGKKTTELYLEKADSTELVQVENVAPGKSGAFSTTTTAGRYLVACEPGMNGHDTQVRTPITVK